jgi:hypothetical protein
MSNSESQRREINNAGVILQPESVVKNQICRRFNSRYGDVKNLSYTDMIKSRALSGFGRAVGQSAFNYVTSNLPFPTIKNNTNSGLRLLLQQIRSGAINLAGKSTNDVVKLIYQSVGISPNLVPTDPRNQTIFNNANVAATTLADSILAGVVDDTILENYITPISALAYVQQNEQAYAEPKDIEDPQCGVTAYARDMIEYAGKMPFLFFTKFTFVPNYDYVGTKNDEKIKFQYLVQKFTKPDISLDHVEINEYGYRFFIPTRTKFGPVKIDIVDDIRNSSLHFIKKYIELRSPVTRTRAGSDTSLSPTLVEQSAMNYSFNSIPTDGSVGGTTKTVPGGTSTFGGLAGEDISVLKYIEVYEVFDNGSKANKYVIANPKLEQATFSNLDMSQTELMMISMQFKIDYIHYEVDIDVDKELENIQTYTELGHRHLLSRERRGHGR